MCETFGQISEACQMRKWLVCFHVHALSAQRFLLLLKYCVTYELYFVHPVVFFWCDYSSLNPMHTSPRVHIKFNFQIDMNGFKNKSVQTTQQFLFYEQLQLHIYYCWCHTRPPPQHTWPFDFHQVVAIKDNIDFKMIMRNLTNKSRQWVRGWVWCIHVSHSHAYAHHVQG